MLPRIFGPKGEEVTGEWRKLRNAEIHNLHFLTDMIRLIGLINGPGMWNAWERRETHAGFWRRGPKE